jgi:hypothetical protein
MRTAIFAILATAALAIPAKADPQPIKGAVQGTATAARGVGGGAVDVGRGVADGTVRAGRGVVQGGRKAGQGILRGAGCVVTLGNRC